jgi:hypothetical protein
MVPAENYGVKKKLASEIISIIQYNRVLQQKCSSPNHIRI